MASFTPKTLTVVENNISAVDHVRVSVRAADGTTELCAGQYPLTGVTTVIPIGSNGLFNPIASPDGTIIRIFVIEVAATGHGDNSPYQEVPGGPFTIETLEDGAEGLSVQL